MNTDLLFANFDKTFSEKDIDFLELLSQTRCLATISGAYQHFFNKIIPRMAYCEEKLRALCENGLIDMVDYPPAEQDVIFLTQLGVDYLKFHADNDLDPVTAPTKSARQLRVSGRMIKHQLAVNDIALDLLDVAAIIGVKIQYYDKLNVPAAFGSFPGDVMFILDDRIVLLKIDTGSVRGEHLYHQSRSYCEFLDNLPPLYRDYAVTILTVFYDDDDYYDDYYNYFNAGSETRWHSIVKSAYFSGLILRLNGKVDFYAVSLDQAYYLLENGFDLQIANSKLFHNTIQLLEKNYQLSCLTPNKFFNKLGCYYSSYYFYRKADDRHLVAEDGRAVEYLVDFWYDGRLSVLWKILNNESNEKMLKNSEHQREVPYVVIVPDMRTVQRIMAMPGIPQLYNVYFTTPDRIKKFRSFPESLFRIDDSLCVWSFRTNSLKHAVFERRLQPYTKRKG